MREPVGTELAKLIPKWATQFNGSCKCRDMEEKMNRWGADGCYTRREHIVAHLMKQSDHLIPAFKLVPDPVKRVIAGKLLRKAIANAKRP